MECKTQRRTSDIQMCTTCSDTLVGETTVNNEHVGHVLRDLEDVGKQKKQNLLFHIEQTKNTISDLKTDLDEVTQKGNEHNNMSNDIKERIQNRGKAFKDSVDTYTKQLVTFCEKQQKGFSKDVEETKLKLKDEIAKATNDVARIESITDAGILPDIIVTEQRNNEDGFKRSNIEKPASKQFTFKEGHKDFKGLQQIFGELDMNPEKKFETDNNENSANAKKVKTETYRITETEVTSLFEQRSTSYGICCISPSPFCDNECWVRFERRKEIRLIDKDGIVKNALTFDPIASSITLSLDKRTFVISPDDHNIKEILPNNTIRTVFSTEWMSPRAMTTSKEGNLLVALVEKWTFQTTSFSKRVLTKFTLRGFKKKEVEFDQNHQRLFMQPAKIAANKQTGDVAVANWTGFEAGHLVLLDKHLRLKFRYFGDGHVCLGYKRYRESAFQDKQFMPQDVAFDSGNNILVAELFSGSVQLLNKDGDLIKVLLADESIPWSLAIQGNGEVWVGYDTGKITTFKYLM